MRDDVHPPENTRRLPRRGMWRRGVHWRPALAVVLATGCALAWAGWGRGAPVAGVGADSTIAGAAIVVSASTASASNSAGVATPSGLAGSAMASGPAPVDAHASAAEAGAAAPIGASSQSVSAPAWPERGRLANARARHLAVDGLDRSYLVQPLPGARGAGRLPVVVLLHGGAQSADDAWRDTSLPTLGVREGFLVVAPHAIDRRWNHEPGLALSGGGQVDDVRFLKAVIADVIAQDHGDPSAVFMVGLAQGGFMTMRFACDAGDALRAGASLLATMPEVLARNCRSPRPLPWLAIVGDADPTVPFAGQLEGAVRRGEAQPALHSADETFRFWADRGGCAAPIVRRRLTDASIDVRHRWAERLERSNCVGGQVSAQIVLHGSGHVLPGLPIDGRLIERAMGPAAPELDGGTLVWAHFKATLLK